MLSAIVITLNEEKMLGDCLKSLQFADEIIVVDTGNTDRTNDIARKFKAKIAKYSGPRDYSAYRNRAITVAKGDWLLYVDADERVTSELAAEIKQVISHPGQVTAYAIPRKNIYLGKELKYGGWGGDYVTRLLKKSALKTWVNPLHEQPEFSGLQAKLTAKLVHISHRDLSSMLAKTLIFTSLEAELRYKAGHPPMTWWRFFRVMTTEFWYRFIKLSAWRDGTEGVIDSIFQVFNTFIIYARLWEMQNKFDEKSLNT
jgi:(heptosyl)LPS beta-1,4-glucosyltransferase